MKRLSMAALAAFLFCLTPAVEAGVIVTIQPSQDGLNVVWSVSWDSLAGGAQMHLIGMP